MVFVLIQSKVPGNCGEVCSAHKDKQITQNVYGTGRRGLQVPSWGFHLHRKVKFAEKPPEVPGQTPKAENARTWHRAIWAQRCWGWWCRTRRKGSQRKRHCLQPHPTAGRPGSVSQPHAPRWHCQWPGSLPCRPGIQKSGKEWEAEIRLPLWKPSKPGASLKVITQGLQNLKPSKPQASLKRRLALVPSTQT